MTEVAGYIYSITVAGLLCGIVSGLLKDTGFYPVAKLATGLFLMIHILQPLGHFSMDKLSDYPLTIESNGEIYAAEGAHSSQNAMAAIILERTRTYILDIAESMGLDITVEVTLNGDNPPIPDAVCITGKVSPYDKLRLEEIITEQLNIPKENQIWIG